MTKQEVKSFRGDFQKAVAQLEAQYGVRISLGTIRFDENGLRAKMEAVKGDAVEVFDKDDFVVGETTFTYELLGEVNSSLYSDLSQYNI